MAVGEVKEVNITIPISIENGVVSRMYRLKSGIIIAIIIILITIVVSSIRKRSEEDVCIIARKSYFETFEIIDKKVYIYYCYSSK